MSSTERVKRYRSKLLHELGADGVKLKRNECQRKYRKRKREEQKAGRRKAEAEEQAKQKAAAETEKDFDEVTDDEFDEGECEVTSLKSGHMTLKHPFTCQITGPSKSGKTFFTRKLLSHLEQMITEMPHKIYWFYGAPGAIKEAKEQFKDAIQFVAGLPSESWEKALPDGPKLVIVDDLMSDMNTGVMSDMFVKSSHHNNMSVIALLQNIYPRKRDSMDMSLNTTYRVIFNNPSDTLQLNALSRRIYGSGCANILRDILTDIKEVNAGDDSAYAYVLIDFDAHTPPKLKARTNIFPGERNMSFHVDVNN
jgi:hypothetical protein